MSTGRAHGNSSTKSYFCQMREYGRTCCRMNKPRTEYLSSSPLSLCSGVATTRWVWLDSTRLAELLDRNVLHRERISWKEKLTLDDYQRILASVPRERLIETVWAWHTGTPVHSLTPSMRRICHWLDFFTRVRQKNLAGRTYQLPWSASYILQFTYYSFEGALCERLETFASLARECRTDSGQSGGCCKTRSETH